MKNGAASGRERGSRGRHGWYASTRGHWHAASATFRAGAHAFRAPRTWSSRALESRAECVDRSAPRGLHVARVLQAGTWSTREPLGAVSEAGKPRFALGHVASQPASPSLAVAAPQRPDPAAFESTLGAPTEPQEVTAQSAASARGEGAKSAPRGRVGGTQCIGCVLRTSLSMLGTYPTHRGPP